MSAKPRLTVGMLVYNGASTLKRALDSLLAQTMEDLQVIIVDNASTDSSGEIAADYAARDPRVSHIRNDKNRGASFSLYKALFMADTDYFAIMHCDLVWAPSYAEKCIKVLVDEPETGLVYSQCQFIDAQGQPTQLYQDMVDFAEPDPMQRYFNVILGLGWCTCWHGLWRTAGFQDLFIHHGSSNSGNAADDNFKLALYSLTNKIRQIKEPLFFRQKAAYQEQEEIADRYARLYGQAGYFTYLFPFLHFIKDHVWILANTYKGWHVHYDVPPLKIDQAIRDITRHLKAKYQPMLEFEIQAAVDSIANGDIKRCWGDNDENGPKPAIGEYPFLDFALLIRLNEDLDYACSLLPDFARLNYARALVKLWLHRPLEAAAALEAELKANPTHLLSLELKTKLKNNNISADLD